MDRESILSACGSSKKRSRPGSQRTGRPGSIEIFPRWQMVIDRCPASTGAAVSSLVRMQSIGDCFGQNEAIETLAVHARNLRCFFYAPGKGNEHNDEVYAKDYRFQDGAEWARARGNEPAVIFGVSGNLRVSRSLTWVGTARHS